MLNTIVTLSGTDANGNTNFEWLGGPGTLFAQGTFASAEVKLQWSIDGEAYADLTDLAGDPNDIELTAPGRIDFNIGACKMRLNVSEATGSTDAIAAVRGNGQGAER